MYFYLYQLKNVVNGKIYIGVHRTENLNDDYMGSGSIIKKAIEKYGVENFERTILQFFSSPEEMYAREKEVVNEDFLKRSDTYNIRRGGLGGFDHINTNDELLAKKRANLKIAIAEKRCGGTIGWTDESFRKTKAQAALNNEQGLTRGWHHTEKFKQEQSKRQAGKNNSQFGSMWITNGLENKKVSKNSPLQEGWRKGRVIR